MDMVNQMYDQIVAAIIRPPRFSFVLTFSLSHVRAEYSADELGPSSFYIGQKQYLRKDFQVFLFVHRGFSPTAQKFSKYDDRVQQVLCRPSLQENARRNLLSWFPAFRPICADVHRKCWLPTRRENGCGKVIAPDGDLRRSLRFYWEWDE